MRPLNPFPKYTHMLLLTMMALICLLTEESALRIHLASGSLFLHNLQHEQSNKRPMSRLPAGNGLFSFKTTSESDDDKLLVTLATFGFDRKRSFKLLFRELKISELVVIVKCVQYQSVPTSWEGLSENIVGGYRFCSCANHTQYKLFGVKAINEFLN